MSKLFYLGLSVLLLAGCASYGVVDNRPDTGSSMVLVPTLYATFYRISSPVRENESTTIHVSTGAEPLHCLKLPIVAATKDQLFNWAASFYANS